MSSENTIVFSARKIVTMNPSRPTAMVGKSWALVPTPPTQSQEPGGIILVGVGKRIEGRTGSSS